MIRALVVEDEPPILNSICKLLGEYSDVLTVVGTAINGRRALEFVQNNPVDLVFTDVKMPVMGGLELAKLLRERHPAVTVVIISGFNEFEFARTAIQYGVKDYLLKPISRQGLYTVLEGISADLRHRRIDRLRNTLRRLALGDETALQELPTEHFCLLLYCEGAFPLAPDEMPAAGRPVGDIAEAERHLAALLPPQSTALVVLGRSVVEKLVLYSNCPGAEAVPQKLFAALLAQNAMPITMVAGGGTVDYIPEAFATLRNKLYRNVCLFHSALYQGRQEAAPSAADFAAWGREMIAALKAQSQGGIADAARQLAALLAQVPTRQLQVAAMLEKLVMGAIGDSLTLHQTESLKQELQTLISRADTPEHFAQDLGEMLYAWVDPGSAVSTGADAEFCEQVATHLRQHHRENISSAQLAAHFQCSAAQLSRRFKEHYKMSVSEYTNQFRVELAQSMLREDKAARVKEIALEVGFSDQYYFSKIFKKLTGQWPSEFMKE